MKKRKKSFPKITVLLLAASAVLLAGSGVGSARAALTYYSENYSAQMNMQSIGVSLVENDAVVSSRDYVSDNEWSGTTEGTLLANMLGEDEKFTPGKRYNEAISVKNSGNIDTFVRVILTRSWQDAEGKKNTSLSPDLIELNYLTDNGWVIAEDQSTPERTVLYYTKALPVGETTPALSDTIRVNESIAQDVTKKVDGNTIRYTYKYDGYSFHVDAEVDAVQTHNAQEAIKSAWGVDVSVNDDETVMSLPVRRYRAMKKKILCLVMTLVMTAGAATTAFARDYQGADGWQVTFDGSKMSSNFQDNDVTDEMANIQPGDSIELKVNVMNSDSGSTDWYMTNEVIQTLEDAQQSAAGGGYIYRLTYVGSDKKEKRAV